MGCANGYASRMYCVGADDDDDDDDDDESEVINRRSSGHDIFIRDDETR